jgi:hypothetical protein
MKLTGIQCYVVNIEDLWEKKFAILMIKDGYIRWGPNCGVNIGFTNNEIFVKKS